LRDHLDSYARARLSVADFEPILDVDADLSFEQITPQLFQALKRLEPFGMGNPEPVFSARDVRMLAPVRVMKDKHVKLRLGAPLQKIDGEAPAAALDSADGPPDSSAAPQRNGWRKSISYNALGWRLAERFGQAKVLAGDTLDIAFTLEHNDHPDFGGLELSLRDFKTRAVVAGEEAGTEASSALTALAP
jgi:single-stranded-DNA-specific exonuclease